jgi:hypothetical protein
VIAAQSPAIRSRCKNPAIKSLCETRRSNRCVKTQRSNRCKTQRAARCVETSDQIAVCTTADKGTYPIRTNAPINLGNSDNDAADATCCFRDKGPSALSTRMIPKSRQPRSFRRCTHPLRRRLAAQAADSLALAFLLAKHAAYAAGETRGLRRHPNAAFAAGSQRSFRHGSPSASLKRASHTAFAAAPTTEKAGRPGCR